VFVVQQGGRIMVVRGGKKLAQPFLDLSSKTNGGGEQGLLSMAFAPDYAKSGLFYVDYTDDNGNSRIVEYKRASADRADPRSARTVLTQDQPEPNHNGGLVKFGPDGLLYIGFGDGGGAGDQHGSRGNAQNLGTWLGKILRIDPRTSGESSYSVPSSNPFVKRSGARAEIYSYGLRNPWRFSFDRRNGNLTIGDVGQDEVEEIDFVRRGHGKGADFGWRVFEGNDRYTDGESAPGAVKPVIERLHSKGNCSITGGVVVRDRRLADLYGRYVFGDLCRGVVESARLRPGAARDVRETRLKVSNLSSFGEDARGRAYVTSLDGPVYRLAARR
jgi:glucose/arabinose dehydrogenase